MTTFYALVARLCGTAAVVCAVLAALTHPGTVRADDISDCYDNCAAIYDPNTNYPDFVTCTGQCQQGENKCFSTNVCDSGCTKSDPCTGGACAKDSGKCKECECRRQAGGTGKCLCVYGLYP